MGLPTVEPFPPWCRAVGGCLGVCLRGFAPLEPTAPFTPGYLSKDERGSRVEGFNGPFRLGRGIHHRARISDACRRAARGNWRKDGVQGHGECVPYARYGEDDRVGPGRKLKDWMPGLTDWRCKMLYPAGGRAQCGVDCAFWDWDAKRAGRRVWDWQDCRHRRRIVTALHPVAGHVPKRWSWPRAKHAARPLLKIKLGTADDMPPVGKPCGGARPDTRDHH